MLRLDTVLMGYIVLTVAFDGILVMLCSEYVLGPRVVRRCGEAGGWGWPKRVGLAALSTSM